MGGWWKGQKSIGIIRVRADVSAPETVFPGSYFSMIRPRAPSNYTPSE